jgi:hypothetical protein
MRSRLRPIPAIRGNTVGRVIGSTPKGSHSYQEAARTFSEFIVKTFPPGSDAKDAIARIISGGFEVTTSSSDSVELRWRRHAGPCSELYSIVVNLTADGTIAKIIGRLHPICL